MNETVQQVAERYARVGEAITKGLPLNGDGAYLMADRYAYPIPVLKDNLGIGSLDAVDRPSGVNEDEKSIVFIVSTQNEDRDGDLVVSKGCRLDNYRLNPVFCWGHQSIEFPIGQARSPDGKITVWPSDNKIVAKCYFDEEDEDAMFIFGKYVRGFLNCTSMAFVPTRAFRRDYEEKARTHSQPLAPPGWVFQEYDLTEISCVTVPSNAQAAVIREWLDHEKSFISPRMQKSLAPYAAQPKGLFRGWGPLPDKDGCYFDGKSWWCPVLEKSAKKSCCSNCEHGKPCGCKSEKGLKPRSSGNVEYDQLKNRTRESLVSTLRNQGTITDMEQIVRMSKEQIIQAILQGTKTKSSGMMTGGGTDLDKPGDTNPQMGAPHSTGKQSQADIEGPVNDPTDRYGKVQIPKVMGSLKLRECVKQRIKDGVKYDDAVKFCSSLMGEGETQPKPLPPRMRRALKAVKPGEVKVGDKLEYLTGSADDQGMQNFTVYMLDSPSRIRVRDDGGKSFMIDLPSPNLYKKQLLCKRCKGEGVINTGPKPGSSAQGRKCPRCKGRAPVITKPFAGYTDFDDCVRQNSSKDNPQAYCGSIQNQVEGKQVKRQQKQDIKRLVKAIETEDGRWALQLVNSPHGSKQSVNSVRFKNREEAERWAGIKGYLLGRDDSKTLKSKGLTGPTRIQIQNQYDKLRSAGMSVREATRKIEEMFGIKNVAINSSGQVANYEQTKAATPSSIRPSSVAVDRKREQLAQNTGAGMPGKVSAGLNEASGTAGGYIVNSEFDPKATGSDPDKDTDTQGYARCTECVGTGNCSNCGGVGQIGDRTPISRAKPDTIRDCEVCGGSGDCKTCDGSGNVKKETTKSYESSLSALTQAVRQKVRELKRDQVTGMSFRNLRQIVSTRGIDVPPGQFDQLLHAAIEQAGASGFIKGNPMATRTKGRRRKASADEPFKPDPSSGGTGAGDDDALSVTKDPIMDDAIDKDTAGTSAVWQPTPMRLAMATNQLRKMGEWMQKEIAGMDNLDGGKALLQKIHDDWNVPYLEALSKALADNYGDQSYDLDQKCMELSKGSGMESDGAGATDPTGEAQMVDAGQVPPDTVQQGVAPEAMPFAGEQTPEEEFLEGESGGEVVPYNNDQPKDLTDPGNPAELKDGTLENMGNMDELKDLCPSCGEDTPGGAKFCPSCGGMMDDGSGKSIDGYDTSNPDTTDVDKTGYAAVPGGTGDDPNNVQPAPFNKDGDPSAAPTDPDTDEILQRYQTPKGWRTKRVGTVRYGADGKVYLVSPSKALSDAGNLAEVKPGSHGPGEGQIVIGSGMLKDMADGLDQIGSGVTGVNQAALSGYSASLRKLMKDLADPGQEADATGAGPHITDEGNPEELKDSTGTGDSVDEGKTPYQGEKSAEDYMKEIKQLMTDEYHFARTRGLDYGKVVPAH